MGVGALFALAFSGWGEGVVEVPLSLSDLSLSAAAREGRPRRVGALSLGEGKLVWGSERVAGWLESRAWKRTVNGYKARWV